VYAIPHALTSPTGEGPHKLIRDGACLVRNAEDILENLNLTAFERHIKVKDSIPDTSDEGQLVALLSREPLHIDEITRKSIFPGPKVIAMLTVLEMKGRVQNIGNMMYVIKN
jgi:DNA processing protein